MADDLDSKNGSTAPTAKWVSAYEHLQAMSDQLGEATSRYEQAGPGAVFLLHGGAAVAALTYAGNVSPSSVAWANFQYALGTWLAGVSLAAASLCCAGVSQWRFAKATKARVRHAWRHDGSDPNALPEEDETWARQDKKGWLWRRVAVGSWGFSVTAFAVGAVFGMFAIGPSP